ncbi:oxalate:formate antiporter [Elysia marginata]|uniref:Oxalate:formate antiporter n=1 Tax=Elysia marginata TaxID=1093978 RepID=A0AAV4IL24_9GAST|nr:oxalate:formate antiporter [Elysia marginata]
MWCYSSEKCRKYSSIIGAHLLISPLSFIWIYGNLSAYMDSYFRFACTRQCLDGDSQWIIGLATGMICPGVLLTKQIADRISLKTLQLLSALVVNAGIFASAWTIALSVAGTTVLLGVNLGVVTGMSTVVAFEYVSGWAPQKASFLMATTSGASTLLSLVQNQIITAIVNPNNLKPDANIGSRTFFSQKEVLDRVPLAVIAYGAMTLGLQLMGYILLAPQTRPDTSSNTNSPNATHKIKPEGLYDDKSIEKHLESSEIQRNGFDREDYGSHDVTNSPISDASKDTTSKTSSLGRNETGSASPTQTPESERSLKPFDVLKTPAFYAVFLFGTSTTYALILKSNFYKQFGLLYIRNDQYLTLVGTLIPVVAAVSRLSVGAALNRCVITIKDAIVFSLSLNSILCSFWYIIPQVDAVLYLFFILCLALVQSLSYLILPVASLNIFGPEHFSTNYGLLQLSLLLVGILSPVVISPLLEALGWFWLFASASICCLLSLVLVVCADFNPRKVTSYTKDD